MSHIKYRPEVDGLRALSVLGVILFHFGLGLPGGYVGVDVFFVISGYLITQIIVRETFEHTFSLKRFWMRRIRRILPAAGCLALCTLIAGFFLLEPLSLVNLAKSGLAYALMLSNVYFWRSSDYFSESAELQPLLHTWSLAVEEQFYILYPLIVFLLLRKSRLLAFSTILALGIVSFVLSAYGVTTHPEATFYLLPTRAWELIAGGLLVIIGDKFALKSWWNEILALAGIVAIACAMILYTGATPFPGAAAMLPVAGATVFIFANQKKMTLTGRIFAWRPLVFIGLLSYSLYLWHWPVLVFSKHILIESTPTIIALELALIGLLAYLSWRYVETPFRKSKRLTKPVPTFSFGALATGSVAALALFFILERGFPSRFTPDMTEVIADIEWAGKKYESQSPSGVPIGVPKDPDEAPDFVLWGDSHGMALTDLVDHLAQNADLKGVALLSSGLPPVTGLWKPGKGADGQKEKTLQINTDRLNWIINSGTHNVILVARWDAMIDGLLDTEVQSGHGRDASASMVTDTDGMPLTPANSREALQRQMTAMVEKLNDAGIQTWLLLQVPSSSHSNVARDFYKTRRYPSINPVSFDLDTPQEEYEHQREQSAQIFSALQSPQLAIIDPLPAFYGNNEYLRLYSERAYFRDEDHLTRAGARAYLEPTLANVFQVMLKNEKNR